MQLNRCAAIRLYRSLSNLEDGLGLSALERFMAALSEDSTEKAEKAKNWLNLPFESAGVSVRSQAISRGSFGFSVTIANEVTIRVLDVFSPDKYQIL